MSEARLILASASPQRAMLLRQLGVDFDVVPANIDEARGAGEAVEHYVGRLALHKARAVLRAALPRVPVLGADTVVCVDGAVQGKPANRDAALLMLTALSGRTHQVFSAVAIGTSERHSLRLSSTRVHFREISAAERNAYWATGEPRGRAGGYAIQGMGAIFITALHGSYSGVMGLPLFETGELMREFAIAVL
jgi:septum formation protein